MKPNTLAVVFLLLCFVAPLRAQLVTEDNVDFSFIDHFAISEGLTNNGVATLTLDNVYHLSSPVYQKYDVEVALKYTRDQRSDVKDYIWEYWVYCNIYADNNLLNTSPLLLVISNKTADGVFEAVTRFKNIASCQQLTLEIVGELENGVTYGGGVSPLDIKMELRLVHHKAETSPSDLSLQVVATQQLTGRKLAHLTWSAVPNVQFYEIAYVFQDDRDYLGNYPSITAQIVESKGIIVETQNNTYDMDLCLPKGRLSLYCRAVTLQHDANGAKGLQTSPWNLAKVAVLDLENIFPGEHWQVTSSFAEEGKYKKVMTYYDRSLRPQQVITFLNDENIAYVAESHYDAEGRATIQILPAPAPNSNNLLYKSNFNRNLADEAYGLFNHEKALADQLNSTSGAGQYYSSANNSSGLYRDYIPDAGGFPFTQSKFIRDNTGRIELQSGAGNVYKAGSGHESKYYYGNPTDTELRRLFGSEIGAAKYYKKTVMVDPNGQQSSTIVDMYGKTVATSLSSDGPTNVLPLPNKEPDIDFFQKLEVSHFEDNIVRKSTNTIFNTTAQTVELKYNFYSLGNDLSQNQNGVSDTCIHCIYELYIRILDPCDAIVQINGQDQLFLGDIEFPNIDIYDCSSQQPDTDISFSVYFDQKGTYKIEKILKAKPVNLTWLKSKAVAVIPSMATLLEQERVKLNIDEECYPTCEYRCGRLFPDKNSQTYRGCISDCAVIGQNTQNEIWKTDCDNRLRLMITQMDNQTPANGASCAELYTVLFGTAKDEYDVFGTSPILRIRDINEEVYIWNNVTLIREADQVVIADKTITIPELNNSNGLVYTFVPNDVAKLNQLMTPSLFQKIFNESLVHCHREYCSYRLCKQMSKVQPQGTLSAKTFSSNLYQIRNYNQALTSFSATNIKTLFEKMIEADPFYAPEYFVSGSTASNCLRSKLQELVDNYEQKFKVPASICALANPTCDFYSIAELLYQDIQNNPSYNLFSNLLAEEKIWGFILNSYNAFKQQIIENSNCIGGPCTYYNDPNTIYVKSFFEETKTYAEAIAYLKGGGFQAKLDSLPFISCGARSDSLVSLFEKEFYKDSLTTLKRVELSNILRDYCNQACDSVKRGTCMSVIKTANVDSIDMGLRLITANDVDSYCGNRTSGPQLFGKYFLGASDFIASGRINHALARNVVLEATNEFNAFNNAVYSNPGFLGGCSDVSLLSLTTQKVVFYEGNDFAEQRIIIHHNNCENPNYNGLQVRVYRALCAGSRSNPTYSLQLVQCNVLRNGFDDYVLEFKEDRPTLSTHMGFVLEFFSTEDPPQNPNGVQKFFTFEIFEKNYKSSKYYPGVTPGRDQITIKPLSDLYHFISTLGSNSCNYFAGSNLKDSLKFNGTQFLKKLWDCESACGIIDPCYESILEKMKTWLNNFAPAPSDVPPFTKSVSGAIPGCCTSIDAVFDQESWYFLIYGAPSLGCDINNPADYVLLRLVTEDGIFPPVYRFNPTYPTNLDYKINMIDFRPTLSTYAANIDMFLGNSFHVPNVKFLISTVLGSDGGPCSRYYTNAYLAIETKANFRIRDLVSACTKSINLDDEFNKCRQEMEKIAFSNASKIFNDNLNNKLAEYLSKIKCIPNAFERFAALYVSKNYHYTLYYYDQLSNLVRTIPPQGVQVVPNSAFDAFGAWNGTTQPQHTKKTEYTYNSFNQIVSSTTPDAGLSNFYYDKVQRLRFSQNALQAAEGHFSYTLFDGLSRITEAGEATLSLTNVQNNLDDPSYPPDNAAAKLDRVKSTYSEPVAGFDSGLSRGRVVQTTRLGAADEPTTSYTYSYDAHGNVKNFRYRLIPSSSISLYLEELDKQVYYDYDLISGKVKQLSYNPGKTDHYYLKYSYDADNRIKQAYSSVDGLLWEEDSRYFYYLHGPLARIEYGEDKVQGQDFVYTLQGWLKAVNYAKDPNLTIEPGKDGNANITTHLNKWMGQDAFAYNLGYNEDDYTAINASNFNFAAEWGQLADQILTSNGKKGLYNGNIATMVTDLRGLNTPQYDFLSVSAFAYKYDQLNRIRKASNAGLHHGGFLFRDSYSSEYTYDKDGNILTHQRTGSNHLPMDDLTYNYQNVNNNNKLVSISDAVSSMNFPNDLDNQGNNNYQYNQIGNLISDNAENLSSISWDVFNKIKKIVKSGNDINYQYDPNGQRAVKYNAFTGYTDYYVRDPQGNILSIYTYGFESQEPVQSEINLYGSSRLGVYKMNRPGFTNTDLHPDSVTGFRTRAYKHYELNNHLGNVLTTISDRKIGNNPNGGLVEYYQAEILSASDYDPFGMQLDDRQKLSYTHRYGFNGKENDSDVKGEGNQQDYGMRIYDPRVARFLSVDPLSKSYPWNSTYAFAENSPLANVDLDGLEKYYAADGSFLGQSGTINDVRVITNKEVASTAKRNLPHKNWDHRWLLKLSAKAYIFNDETEKEIYKEWAIENEKYTKSIDDKRERTMTLYTKAAINEEGKNVEIAMPGTTAVGDKTVGGGRAHPEDSELKIDHHDLKIEFGWKAKSNIHTHPFGCAKEFSKEYNELGGIGGDIGYSISAKMRFFLVSLKNAGKISMFDPEVYLKRYPEGLSETLDRIEKQADYVTDESYIRFKSDKK